MAKKRSPAFGDCICGESRPHAYTITATHLNHVLKKVIERLLAHEHGLPKRGTARV